MRIVGLVILGLLLLNGGINIVMNLVVLIAGTSQSAPAGYLFGRLMGSIAITAIIAFFFFKLLKKNDG